MKGLRTFLWLVLILALVAFTAANWNSVEVRIWPGLVMDAKLPGLVIGAFLGGLVPTALVLQATRWRLGRRIANLEATLGNSGTANSSSLPSDRTEPQS
ncbi:DUF1049 domain-containing protein [Novosphingobium sp. FKTRR1]|uniref:DUF1049 domain-containing protein n=1 Tax=Novosphingobium sp. FKTRR1 TaxID=2879118 RepID=UPI001CF035D2|nr:DUF1049 domain-containing protein [Novosphingobium sp. FKTRR1]